MNNRYICKAKRKDNGEWVYGNLIQRKIWSSEFYVIRVEDNGFDNYEEYEVIPETICQCTTLTDKNGKLIFTGDLLRFTNSDNEQSIYKVFYDDVYAGYRIQEIDLGGLDEMSNWENNRECFEVIGNIHDNPELLEVER